MRRLTGAARAKEWGIRVLHALYREDGKWYHVLKRFPGALFDAHGYIRFDTEENYTRCFHISIKRETNSMHAPAGIACLPGYIRVK